MRADARRNAERLLACAHEAFTERGADASLEDIARRAGVGIGTLYRHFPNRNALLAALLTDRFQAISQYAADVLEWQPPEQAVAGWIRAVCQHATAYQGLGRVLMAQLLEADEDLTTSCDAVKAAGDRLLTKAKQAGLARAELAVSDLIVLANSLAWAAENSQCATDRFELLLTVITTGLHP